MENIYKNKNLFNGGPGSIAQEIVCVILEFKPKIVRILNMDETKQFELQPKVNLEEKYD